MTGLAVIADTHGNTWALKAVLDDIRRRGVTDIVNLGDSADADMDPGTTLELLMGNDITSIAGNYETFVDGQLTSHVTGHLVNHPQFSIPSWREKL